MSKHGGSPESGLVVPVGLEALKPALPEGMVLVPQEVVDARKQADERKERALQLERRRIADNMLRGCAALGGVGTQAIDEALHAADELIKKTGGGI